LNGGISASAGITASNQQVLRGILIEQREILMRLRLRNSLIRSRDSGGACIGNTAKRCPIDANFRSYQKLGPKASICCNGRRISDTARSRRRRCYSTLTRDLYQSGGLRNVCWWLQQ
jgi:hypothetical protein